MEKLDIGTLNLDEKDDILNAEDEERSNHEDEELTEDAQALKEELAQITVHPPTVDLYVHFV